MKSELQATLGRHKQYDNIDGTGEMFMGLMLLSFAVEGYLQTLLPEHSLWRTNGLAGLLFMYAILLPGLGLGFLLQRIIKKHVTWPCTGYVGGHSVWRALFAPQPAGAEAAAGVPTKMGMLYFILAVSVVAGVIGAAFALLLLLSKSAPGALNLARVAYLGFWVPLYAFWVSRMGREQMWKWFIVLFMALGLLTIGLFGPGGFEEVSRRAILFVGLVWILSGLATLFSYLLHTRPPAAEAQ